MRADPRVLLMAGVVVGAFANAAIMVLLATVPAEAAKGALWWMMGSLGSAHGWMSRGWAVVLAIVGPAAAALGARPRRAVAGPRRGGGARRFAGGRESPAVPRRVAPDGGDGRGRRPGGLRGTARAPHRPRARGHAPSRRARGRRRWPAARSWSGPTWPRAPRARPPSCR